MRITVAGLQATGVPGDVEANLRLIAAGAEEARARGADLLVTPEMFVTGYNLPLAELEALTTDDLVDRVAAVARRSGLAIAAGLPERAGDGLANSVVLVDADGAVLHRYRKTHLFGALDRNLFVAGDSLPGPIEFRGVKLGFLICYDVEFPETVRSAALAGADLVIVPTAQMEPFEFLAEHLIRVRAWENQVYVAYVNRSGSEGSLRYVGRSSIVSPSGEVLDHRSGGDDSGLVLAVVDTDIVQHSRTANPYLTDRRLDLYPLTDPSQP